MHACAQQAVRQPAPFSTMRASTCRGGGARRPAVPSHVLSVSVRVPPVPSPYAALVLERSLERSASAPSLPQPHLVLSLSSPRGNPNPRGMLCMWEQSARPAATARAVHIYICIHMHMYMHTYAYVYNIYMHISQGYIRRAAWAWFPSMPALASVTACLEHSWLGACCMATLVLGLTGTPGLLLAMAAPRQPPGRIYCSNTVVGHTAVMLSISLPYTHICMCMCMCMCMYTYMHTHIIHMHIGRSGCSSRAKGVPAPREVPVDLSRVTFG